MGLMISHPLDTLKQSCHLHSILYNKLKQPSWKEGKKQFPSLWFTIVCELVYRNFPIWIVCHTQGTHDISDPGHIWHSCPFPSLFHDKQKKSLWMRMTTIHLIRATVQMPRKKMKSWLYLMQLHPLTQMTVLLLCLHLSRQSGKPRSLRRLLTKRVRRWEVTFCMV